MFSFFDYLRRRTCDAVLAGVYDAFELIETRNAEEQLRAAELLIAKFDREAGPKPIAAAPGAAPQPGQARPPGQSTAVSQGGQSFQPRKRGRPPKGPGGPGPGGQP